MIKSSSRFGTPIEHFFPNVGSRFHYLMVAGTGAPKIDSTYHKIFNNLACIYNFPTKGKKNFQAMTEISGHWFTLEMH